MPETKSHSLNILVTGGAGFIGSHVVDAYIRAGHRVTVLDSLATGRMTNLDGRAQFFHDDIRSASLDAIFQQRDFDLINHQSAHIDLRRSVAHPRHDADVNIPGTTSSRGLVHVKAKYKST